MNRGVHDNGKRLEAQLRILSSDNSISDENKSLICRFKDFAFSEK